MAIRIGVWSHNYLIVINWLNYNNQQESIYALIRAFQASWVSLTVIRVAMTQILISFNY